MLSGMASCLLETTWRSGRPVLSTNRVSDGLKRCLAVPRRDSGRDALRGRQRDSRSHTRTTSHPSESRPAVRARHLPETLAAVRSDQHELKLWAPVGPSLTTGRRTTAHDSVVDHAHRADGHDRRTAEQPNDSVGQRRVTEFDLA